MGLGHFFKILAKLFNVLAWPSFSLVYPLYASIRAVESDKPSYYQQCLSYWVLFSISTFLELALEKLLVWLPFWPHAKGIATLLLVIPYFRGASYVYVHFIRPYISVNSQIQVGLPIPVRKVCTLNEQNEFLNAAGRYTEENGPEEVEKLVICEVESGPKHDTTREIDLTWLAIPKKVQKEWSCALCLVSTTSAKCLRKHLRGKKHKAKEEELRQNEVVMSKTANFASAMKKNDRMVLLESFNQITRANLDRLGGFLSPVARSITWCTWKKPKFGWTKLNTDGSIDRDSTGFGGLFRDYKGDPICAYASKAPCDDIFLVELWAIWRGLVLASGLQIRLIWVESDSLSVVNSINKKQPYGPKASSCLKHIWELLKMFEKYRVSHSWRETNRAADHLAKMDILGSDVVLWPVDFPNSLRKIIMDDAQGRRYRRG